MSDFTIAAPALAAREDSATGPVPPQLLARWAAIAGERACLAFLPQQAPQA